MLSILSSSPQKCTPNLLPARIHHSGPVNDTRRYWQPETETGDTGKQHAYLRGRRLYGTSLPLPTNHAGAILHITDKQLPQSPAQPQKSLDDAHNGEDSIEEQHVQISIAEQIGTFDEVVVWGHGGHVKGLQDGYTRAMNEWVAFAESMHVDEGQDDGHGDKETV